MAEPEASGINESVRKPRLLRFLCILTFLWSGCCMLATISVFTRGLPLSLFGSIPVIDSMIIEDTHGNNLYLLIKVLLLAITIAGAAVIWIQRPTGLWMYITAQLLLLAIPFIFLSHLGFSYLLVKFFTDLIFTALFIVLYIFLLRKSASLR